MYLFRQLSHKQSAQIYRSYQKTQLRASMLAWIGSLFEPGVSKDEGSIFDYTVDDISGNPMELSSIKGKKAYLVVNVASQ